MHEGRGGASVVASVVDVVVVGGMTGGNKQLSVRRQARGRSVNTHDCVNATGDSAAIERSAARKKDSCPSETGGALVSGAKIVNHLDFWTRASTGLGTLKVELLLLVPGVPETALSGAWGAI